jgi:hypothetical protein
MGLCCCSFCCRLLLLRIYQAGWHVLHGLVCIDQLGLQARNLRDGHIRLGYQLVLPASELLIKCFLQGQKPRSFDDTVNLHSPEHEAI